MTISNKTRKILWSRSGNRCAMCQIEIVLEQNEHGKNLNIGQECHIISQKPNGPRHLYEYNKDYDSYDNLILLCANHHRTIDELWEQFPIELLVKIKVNHENWIKLVIDKAKDKEKRNDPKILPQITTGKQIVDIIRDVDIYQYENDDLKTIEEIDFISKFLQYIQDCGEFSDFEKIEIGQLILLTFEINNKIEELDKLGFYIFGERKKVRLLDSKKVDIGIFKAALFIILRKDNPQIIRKEKYTSHIIDHQHFGCEAPEGLIK